MLLYMLGLDTVRVGFKSETTGFTPDTLSVSLSFPKMRSDLAVEWNATGGWGEWR